MHEKGKRAIMWNIKPVLLIERREQVQSGLAMFRYFSASLSQYL
jgi:hypothetical protein